MSVHRLALFLFSLISYQCAYGACVDLIIFSYDRPLQLYALLESVEKYVQGVGETVIVCRASEAQYAAGYQVVAAEFTHVKFLMQGEHPREDFKPLTLQATFDTPSQYVIYAVDDIVVKDFVDLAQCIDLLERTGAYGFYLRLGDHLNFCYTMQKKQAVPPLSVVKDDVLSWVFASGSCDWGYPNTVDMTVYAKAEIEPLVRSMSYSSPNTFEGRWSTHAGPIKQRKGLCYTHSKIVNLPLNRVQHDNQNLCMAISASALHDEFMRGNKMDIAPLHQIKNRSAHMEYQPTFIKRTGR